MGRLHFQLIRKKKKLTVISEVSWSASSVCRLFSFHHLCLCIGGDEADDDDDGGGDEDDEEEEEEDDGDGDNNKLHGCR